MTTNLATDAQIVTTNPKLRAKVEKTTSSNAKPGKTQKAPARSHCTAGKTGCGHEGGGDPEETGDRQRINP